MIKKKEITWLSGFTIAGICVRTTNQNGQAQKDIGELWARFIAGDVAKNIRNRVSEDIYSVYTEYAGDHTQAYSVILGCKVISEEALTDGLVAINIPAGRYEMNKVEGEMPASVMDAWEQIWRNGEQRIYTVDFEVYRCDEEGLRIYLAVE